jgi:hypothetical protein
LYASLLAPDSSYLHYSLTVVSRGPAIISRSLDKGLGRDKVITGVLPFCTVKKLTIVGGHGTPVVAISIFFDFLPTYLSKIRS